jgi:electron transfer flavoprotein beta subunit
MPHIICLVKQVPDPETPASQFKVDESAKKVIPAPGVQPVASQFDTIGVEAALRIKDKQPDTTVTVVTLGPDSFRDALKTGLAMGADEGVHINDPAVNDSDHWATAEALAAAVQKLAPFDIIIAGRQSTDWDMGVVGSTIAEIVGVPVVTLAKDVQLADGKVTVERVLLDGFETVEAPTPAVVTVSNELGEPRYPQLKQIMMAARKEVKVWTTADLGVSPQNRVNLEALFIPETKVETEVIEGETAQEKAQKLAQRLREAKLI